MKIINYMFKEIKDIRNLEDILQRIKDGDQCAIKVLDQDCFSADFRRGSSDRILYYIVNLVKSGKLNANQIFHLRLKYMENESEKIIRFTPLSIALCECNLSSANALLDCGASSFYIPETMKDPRYEEYTEENLDFIGHTIFANANPINGLFSMVYELESRGCKSGMKLLERVLSDRDENDKNVLDHLSTDTLMLILNRASMNLGFLNILGPKIIENLHQNTRLRLQHFCLNGTPLDRNRRAFQDSLTGLIFSTERIADVEPLQAIAARSINTRCKSNTLRIKLLQMGGKIPSTKAGNSIVALINGTHSNYLSSF